jgi:hypothetical protein
LDKPSELKAESSGIPHNMNHLLPPRQVHPEIALPSINTALHGTLWILFKVHTLLSAIIDERLFHFVLELQRDWHDLYMCMAAFGAQPRDFKRHHCCSIFSEQCV